MGGKRWAERKKRRFDASVRYWLRQGYNADEIAHILGCSIPKVIASLKRVRKAQQSKRTKK